MASHTFRSDSTQYTTLKVTLTETGRSGNNVTVRVDWIASLGNQTNNNSNSNNNRTLYIYRSNGSLLGSSLIKNCKSWVETHTYNGSFSITFDTGTTQAGTWALYIQTSDTGTQSCIWTNRSYCVNFDFSWSLYWSKAGAASNLSMSPSPYENLLSFSWKAAAPGVNNAVTKYQLRYRLNSGSQTNIDTGAGTTWSLNTSSWSRGTVMDFGVCAFTVRGDNPWSGWSKTVVKNRAPNQPTGLSLTKAFFVPGEIIRVSFTNTGDPDGNLAGFEAATEHSVSVKGSNPSGTATYIDINTAGWTLGVYYRIRVRGYDSYGIKGGWSDYSAVFMIGLPMKIAPAEGAAAKVAASMKIAPAQGSINKAAVGIKIAPAQGPINKTVF